ncbi:MAG: tetratricopeptide repeat protein, partial [Myxococcales bacterium]|nr:tetratricopeptide repeat protein [Myxococcales bacterium]
YAARWIDGHRSACRATRVAGTQSEQVLDQRMGCLARAAAKLDAVARFLEADATTAVAYADDTLATLPDVGQCADPDQLGALDALPADPVRNARARELMATVADLQVGVRGEDRVSLDAARTALEAARALAWTPLVVEAAWAYGTAAAYEDDPDAARDGFREAALGALSLGNDAFAAGTLSDLADVYADLGDDKTALTWLDVAEAIAQRRPLNAGTRLHLLGNRSDVLRHAGRVDDAVAAAEAELALAREMSEDGEYVGGALHNLAVTQLAAGHLQEALRTSDEAVAETERVLGPDHPKLASLLMNASMFDTRAGHVDAAIAKARRGIAILDRWYGHEHPKVDALLNNLAVALRMHGDTAEARSLFEEVQRRRAARLGERSLDNGEALCNLAIMDLEDGELAIATTRAAEGLAVMESVLGPDDPELANALVLNGGIARYRGDLDASVAYLERAVAVVERGRGVDSPDAVNPRVELAHTEAARGHHARAVEVLTPSLALTERSADVPPEAAAETRFAMATSMVHVGGDRARAIALARQARDGYVGLGDGYASKVDDIDAWLATVTPARRGGR